MTGYREIAAMLPDNLPLDVRYGRIVTASALFRQAMFTLETQGMPGPVVMAVVRHVLATEATSRAAQEAALGKI